MFIQDFQTDELILASIASVFTCNLAGPVRKKLYFLKQTLSFHSYKCFGYRILYATVCRPAEEEKPAAGWPEK